jgi:hypothetical protein
MNTETESSPENVVLNNIMTTNNVQKVNNYFNLNCLCTAQSINNATNCSFFLTLSLSTHVSALNDDLQAPYYAKTAALH